MKMRTCIETSKVGTGANHPLDLINTTEEEVQVGTGGLITVKARKANTPRGEAGAGVSKLRMVKVLKASISTRTQT